MKPVVLSLLLSATLGSPAVAQTPTEPQAGDTASAATAAADLADGEVRKVDAQTGKITLKHGEIKRLDMPPMTMVFTVRDKAMLDKVKVGDKVKFMATHDAGQYTVTDLQVVR